MVSIPAPGLILSSDGRHFLVVEGLTVGRGPDNGLLLEDSSVSTHHAVFHQVGGRWTVKDLNSTNGTKLNGSRIQGTTPLSEGDLLKFGAVELRFEEIAGFAAPQPERMIAAPPPLPAPQLPPALPIPPPLPMQIMAPPPLPARRPVVKSKSHAGLWIVLGAGVVLLMLLLGAWFLRDRLMPTKDMQGFLSFREQGGKDPREALTGTVIPIGVKAKPITFTLTKQRS